MVGSPVQTFEDALLRQKLKNETLEKFQSLRGVGAPTELKQENTNSISG